MSSELNKINTWAQGYFVDQPQYDHMGVDWKMDMKNKERHLVRPYALGNAICMCHHPDDAKWIAERLNIAANNQGLKERLIEAVNALRITGDGTIAKAKDNALDGAIKAINSVLDSER